MWAEVGSPFWESDIYTKTLEVTVGSASPRADGYLDKSCKRHVQWPGREIDAYNRSPS